MIFREKRGVMRSTVAIIPFAVLLTALPAMAGDGPQPKAGPVFSDFGQVFAVDPDVPVAKDATFRIMFDVSEGAKPGAINVKVNSAARFINMQVAAGVPEKNIRIALVVHGGAGADLLTNEAYRARNDDRPNPSAAPISQLLAHGVDIYLCGQTAAARGYAKADLIPGVKIALSAMTISALLQQQGYTLNPS